MSEDLLSLFEKKQDLGSFLEVLCRQDPFIYALLIVCELKGPIDQTLEIKTNTSSYSFAKLTEKHLREELIKYLREFYEDEKIGYSIIATDQPKSLLIEEEKKKIISDFKIQKEALKEPILNKIIEVFPGTKITEISV